MIEILISIFYASTGVIATAGYVPTIKDLVKKKQSANIPSYYIWAFTYFIGLLYASMVIQDLLFSIVSGAGFIACITILFLAHRIS